MFVHFNLFFKRIMNQIIGFWQIQNLFTTQYGPLCVRKGSLVQPAQKLIYLNILFIKKNNTKYISKQNNKFFLLSDRTNLRIFMNFVIITQIDNKTSIGNLLTLEKLTI